MSGFGRQLINPAENDPLNRRVNSALNGTLDELSEEGFEFWPKEQVKEAIVGLQRADLHQQDVQARVKNAEAWFVLHPEYCNTPTNNALMNHELVVRFGETAWSIDQYDEVYASLRASNFLNIDKVVEAAQQKQAAKQRAEEHRARTVMPSEQELYSMPFDELERRARGF
jgi:hypothetical protein